MKDSIIAGTGNSRYLRTSISADTTWEDALTMLRAGTFPIDLAGINAAGFIQIGTALNTANLLKSAVVTALGLDSNATPSDAWEAVIALINDKVDATEAAGAAPVQSVAGKTGDVTLDGGNISYNDSATYPSGSVGAEVADLKSAFVMPESFGAKSDWNTDDTEAIQATIDYAVANHIYTVLLSGAYRITEPLKIPPGFRLMGHANGYGAQKKLGYLKVDGCSAISFSLADTELADGSHVFACTNSSIENIHFLQINTSSPFITFHGTGSESLSSVQMMNGGIKNCNIKGFSSFCGSIGFQAFDISNMVFILPKFGSGLRISDCHWNNWFFSSSGLGLLYSSSSPVFESAFIRASHFSNMFFTGDTTAPSAGPNCCLRICGASAFSLDNIVFDYYPARALSFEQGSGSEYNNGISASNLMFRGCSTEQYSAINIEYAKNLHFDKVIFKNTHIPGFAPRNLFASISNNAYNENIYADGFEQESDYSTGSIESIIFKFTTFTHSNMGYEKRSANTNFVKKSIYATVPANGTVRAAPSDIGSIPLTVVRLYTDGLPDGVKVIQVEPIGAKVYLTYSNSTSSAIQMSGAVLGVVYETMY